MSVDIADKDVIKMIEEYLANRHLDITLMCLERETGVINGMKQKHYSVDFILGNYFKSILKNIITFKQ